MTKNDRDMTQFFALIAATIVIVGAAMVFAHADFVASVERQEAERVALRIESLASAGVLYLSESPSIEEGRLPFGSVWEALPSLRLAVTPQAITMPVLEDPVIESLEVQGITDGEKVVWRLTWEDPTPDMNVDSGRFSDAVALQFPIAPDASFMMGEEKKMVQILHWKGIWQKDVDEHFQDVQDLHPNFWADLYWFAEGEFPYPLPESFADERSHAWFPAYRAGNPVSDFHRQRPVEELVAEGYGTLTHQPQCATQARGQWRDGQWAVVFERPLATGDPLDYQMRSGQRGQFAVAVWEGGAGNVGGRKHWSSWFEFQVAS